MSKTAIEQALKLVKSSRRQVARMLKTVGRDDEYSESLLEPIHRELREAQKTLESLVECKSSATELAEAAGIEPWSVKTLASLEAKERYELWGYEANSDELKLLVNNKSRRTCNKVAKANPKSWFMLATSKRCLIKWFKPVE